MIDVSELEGKVHVGDCLEFMRGLPDGCVDLVLTDPPYNVGFDYGDAVDDERLDYQEWCLRWLRDALRVSQGVVLTPGTVNLQRWLSMGIDCENVMAWFRKNAQSPARANAWMNKWEPILAYGKTPKRAGWDAWSTPVIFDTGLPHPCVKTETIWRAVMDSVSNPGDLVLDPFLGSGTTAVVCERLGRRWIGCEINPEYAAMAEKRIQRERDKLQLPFDAAEGSVIPQKLEV